MQPNIPTPEELQLQREMEWDRDQEHRTKLAPSNMVITDIRIGFGSIFRLVFQIMVAAFLGSLLAVPLFSFFMGALAGGH